MSLQELLMFDHIKPTSLKHAKWLFKLISDYLKKHPELRKPLADIHNREMQQAKARVIQQFSALKDLGVI